MRFGKTNLLALVLAAFFFGLANLSHAQSQATSWKFAVGDRFKVSLNQNSSANTKVESRKTLIETVTDLEMSWDVVKVTTETATIEQTILGISLAVSNPAVPIQAIAFDTSASQDEAKEYSKSSKTLLKQIKPLVGLKFNVTMALNGEIKEVALPPASAEVINQLPDTVRLRQLFSPKGLNAMLGASAIVFPDKPIDAGSSWTEEKSVTTPLGEFARKRIYTVVGKKTVDGQELTEIRMEPKLEAKEQAVAESEPVKSSLHPKLISFSGSGILMVDNQGGYLKSSSFENELKSERPYREKTIETTVKNQIRMTISKLVEEK